jgi:hypothetical protein
MTNSKLPAGPVVTRKIFVCTECEGIYADEPTSRCDCLGSTQVEQRFIETTVSYVMPKPSVEGKKQ